MTTFAVNEPAASLRTSHNVIIEVVLSVIRGRVVQNSPSTGGTHSGHNISGRSEDHRSGTIQYTCMSGLMNSISSLRRRNKRLLIRLQMLALFEISSG
jgi:hypothetical protein